MPSPSLHDARHAAMRWNAPLSLDHATLLLDRLDLAPDQQLLDLGCGWGELLLRAVDAAGGLSTGTGVDIDTGAVRRGRSLAEQRGLSQRVTLHSSDAASWREPADRVLCVGSAHIWGGAPPALRALAPLVRPGGRLLLGEGCWEREPGPEAAALFAEVVPLGDLARLATTSGWQVLHLSTADQREWDDFEASWRRGRQLWLLEHPDDERAARVQAEVEEQQREYVEVYRGILGFAYLVLAR